MEQFTVTILGREYRLSCAPEEKLALLNAVNYVDDKMNMIRASGKVTGTDRIAVLAALNIANELLSESAGKKSHEKLAFLEFEHKIENLKAMIERAIAPQDKLL
jgi:cell division protein ZapA